MLSLGHLPLMRINQSPNGTSLARTLVKNTLSFLSFIDTTLSKISKRIPKFSYSSQIVAVFLIPIHFPSRI
ncbi:hypothetical protein L1987_60765 [Smallanthus sonchifolius]|uniref:Uncharacterized protein n=1 Tax=Smallanthus sonchifolius TaxID=185202 RepID=A0ACB9D8W2_9ASTR|nr:hypothetical protein L1987_60765 [Smallanthus sonchifolius]